MRRVPVRAFGARPRQVDRFGLPEQVVELHEHEPSVAASQLGMDGGEHRAGRPRPIELVALVGGGLVLTERGKALTQMRPFGPRLVGRRSLQLAALEALVDVATAPPTGESGQVVG